MSIGPLLVSVPPSRFRLTPVGRLVLPEKSSAPERKVIEPLGKVKLLNGGRAMPSMTRSPLPPNAKLPPLLKPNDPTPVPSPPMRPPSQANGPVVRCSVLPVLRVTSPSSKRALAPPS